MLTSILQPPTSISELITSPPPTPSTDNGSRIVEFPYIYVFDGTGLTNGTSPTNNNMSITADADFYLRRVFGAPAIAAKIQIRQPYGKQYQSNLEAFPADYPIVREIKFAADSSIQFDLGTVAKLVNGAVPLAYMGFQGAKRMLLSAIPYDTPYAFKRLPVTHQYSLTLDWAYSATIPTRMQTLLLNNYDFELHCIRIINTATNTAENGSYSFAMLLYDAFGNQTSNLPVMNEWINQALRGATSTLAGGSSRLSPCFPVPPLIYPRNSMIRFDIQSLLAAGSKSIQIQFCGFDRYPLGG